MKNLLGMRKWKKVTNAGIIMMVLFPLGILSAGAEEVTVMSRNLYLGANLNKVIAADSPEKFLGAIQQALEQVAANNFPERAQALAAEIVEKKPHLVGLQEVFDFTLNENHGSGPFRDYLEDLMAALEARGARYRVAAVVKNLDLAFLFAGNLLGVVDRDVILARNDVATMAVPLVATGCRVSMDGCNYQVVAQVDSPLGPIAIERGFVAIDASVGDTSFRFVNTHLEERDLDPGNPMSPALQAFQALELIQTLQGIQAPDNPPIVLVGDINSSPEDPVVNAGQLMIIPPYRQFEAAGFLDTWTLRPGLTNGYSCCQEESLLNWESVLNQRIDMVFATVKPGEKVKVNLTGNEEADKTPSGLWPSDHAGVVTRLGL
jgi:endonuclease/exonuclease/phosphatase family metal-dependent hydrolase